MLNISENSIDERVKLHEFDSFKLMRSVHAEKWILLVFGSLVFIILGCLFVPWTQNINAKGYVNTRDPSQRPQGMQAVIPGRIQEWYVQEGDFVYAGDTIAHLTEIKSEYFDSSLVERTREQIDAKLTGIQAYDDKSSALSNQYSQLERGLLLKREQISNKAQQARNKITIDSADLVAFEANLEIAENQLERFKEMYDKGVKSLTDFQDKELKVQETRAKVTSQRNKLMNQRRELTNAIIEQSLVEREYGEKLAKADSDRQSVLSARSESVGATAKLENQYSNYAFRQQFYYITAPQDGYVTKTMKKGLGELIKEGDDIATIAPTEFDLTVEMFVKPQDLPLVNIGEEARLRFDGWPAIVISGWPEASTGIFTGEVVAVDRFISENGQYRILISPMSSKRSWPKELRVGTGAQAFVLLNDVPIWYELWRQLNGFPAQFYDEDAKDAPKELKRKAPGKSIK
ncbi:HlyD family secretion protein [Neolewinella antarctica]|uniref:Multidrug resistance efflux pump n=1 Tax=Neolewinella antarctica TaxID=442734 RepID=A0ABX0X8W2_9BACT|nr:HlyD family efflux transporter periplasmic adaptor subunit [Neolewinella antarctica]NJC25431.1 multidrug resistance efflux pump [Neolewinella antarctica]